MKKPKQHKIRPEAPSTFGPPGDVDWQPLYRALQNSIDWALDIAAKLAAPYPEEVDAIERVRAFVRAKLLGKPAQVRVADVMLAFGIVIAAIERDLSTEADAREGRAPFRLSVGASDAPTAPLFGFRIPTAGLWEPPVTRHCPGAFAGFRHRAPHVRFIA